MIIAEGIGHMCVSGEPALDLGVSSMSASFTANSYTVHLCFEYFPVCFHFHNTKRGMGNKTVVALERSEHHATYIRQKLYPAK